MSDPRLLPPADQTPAPAEQTAPRVIPGRFLPGQSGNPNGRPRKAGRPIGSRSRYDLEVQRHVGENWRTYVKRLEELSTQDQDQRVAFAATAKLVDIALLAPPTDRPDVPLRIEALTLQEQKQLARLIGKAQRRMERGHLPGAPVPEAKDAVIDVVPAKDTLDLDSVPVVIEPEVAKRDLRTEFHKTDKPSAGALRYARWKARKLAKDG